MPDICMCRNDNCVAREKCYRYCAVPTPHWQTYFAELDTKEKCEHFWPLQKSEDLEKK